MLPRVIFGRSLPRFSPIVLIVALRPQPQRQRRNLRRARVDVDAVQVVRQNQARDVQPQRVERRIIVAQAARPGRAGRAPRLPRRSLPAGRRRTAENVRCRRPGRARAGGAGLCSGRCGM